MTILTLIKQSFKPNIDKIRRTDEYVEQQRIQMQQHFTNRFL